MELSVLINVKVEQETKDALERLAAEQERTLSQVVRSAIARYLEMHADEAPAGRRGLAA